jgi:hypothetical protein
MVQEQAASGGVRGCSVAPRPEETMARTVGFWSACALFLTLCFAWPATAQQSVPTNVPAAAPAGSFAPTLNAVRFGITDATDQPTTVNPAAASAMGRREGRVLTLVGGAAVIAGVLIGDTGGTVIAIGGAAIGLYGLYIWQR